MYRIDFALQLAVTHGQETRALIQAPVNTKLLCLRHHNTAFPAFLSLIYPNVAVSVKLVAKTFVARYKARRALVVLLLTLMPKRKSYLAR